MTPSKFKGNSKTKVNVHLPGNEPIRVPKGKSHDIEGNRPSLPGSNSIKTGKALNVSTKPKL